MTPSAWPTSGAVAVVLGAVVWLLLLFPLVVAQYRRYGDISASRLAGSAALSLYLAALASYTLLPLPPHSEQWCQVHGTLRVQDNPGQGIKRALWLYTQVPLRSFVTNHSVVQLALNLVLFTPWGVFARKFLGYGVVVSVVTGFALSVFIEATQYTGLWWIFPCGWRVVDVDDVIINTAGAAVGVILAPLFMWWMPVAGQLAAHRTKPRPITSVRRYMAMIFDVAVFVLAAVLTDVLLRTFLLAVVGVNPALGGLVDVAALVFAWLIVMLIPALIQGVTLGENTVYLQAVTKTWSRQPDTWVAMARVSAVSLPLTLSLAHAAVSDIPQRGLALAGLLALASTLTIFLTDGRASVGDALLRTRVRDTREGTHTTRAIDLTSSNNAAPQTERA